MSDAILRKNSGDILASNLMPITNRCVVRIGHGFITADAPSDFLDVTLYASQDERYSAATMDEPIWLGADDIRHVMARYPEKEEQLDLSEPEPPQHEPIEPTKPQEPDKPQEPAKPPQHEDKPPQRDKPHQKGKTS